MTIIPPGYANCALRFDHGNYPRPSYITFGVQILGSTTPAAAVAEQVAQGCTPVINGLLDSNATWTQTRVWVGQDGGDPLVGEENVPRQGLANRDSVSPGVAVLVRKGTETGGRRGRGAVYLPWAISRTAVSETGSILPVDVAGLQTAMTTWLADLEDNTPMVVLHSAGLTAPPAPSLVQTLTVSPTISRQGRRQLR